MALSGGDDVGAGEDDSTRGDVSVGQQAVVVRWRLGWKGFYDFLWCGAVKGGAEGIADKNPSFVTAAYENVGAALCRDRR